MEFVLSVNSNLEIINNDTSKIKAVAVGTGIVTITSGGLTKEFDIHVLERASLDMDLISGEHADAVVEYIEPINIDSSSLMGESNDIVLEDGIPPEPEQP